MWCTTIWRTTAVTEWYKGITHLPVWRQISLAICRGRDKRSTAPTLSRLGFRRLVVAFMISVWIVSLSFSARGRGSAFKMGFGYIVGLLVAVLDLGRKP